MRAESAARNFRREDPRSPRGCAPTPGSPPASRRGRMGKPALVPRVAENGAVLLSPLFAGRGRVRGLGDWPLGSRLSQRQMKFAANGLAVSAVWLLTRAPHPTSPRKEAGRGDLPNCQRRAELERSPRRQRHRRRSTRSGAARKFSCLQVIEKSRNQKILAPPSPAGAARPMLLPRRRPWAVPQPRIGGEHSPSDCSLRPH